MKPGQRIRDLFIGTPIRQDLAIELGKQIKAAVDVEGEVTVLDSLVIPMLCKYGELMIMYWIDEDEVVSTTTTECDGMTTVTKVGKKSVTTTTTKADGSTTSTTHAL
jgi:hypothetical protein